MVPGPPVTFTVGDRVRWNAARRQRTAYSTRFREGTVVGLSQWTSTEVRVRWDGTTTTARLWVGDLEHVPAGGA